MKYYVLLENLDIGYVDYICNCSQCKERGNAEIIVNNMNDESIYNVTIKRALNREDVIAISDDYNDLLEMRNTMLKTDYFLCRLLENELLKGNDNE